MTPKYIETVDELAKTNRQNTKLAKQLIDKYLTDYLEKNEVERLDKIFISRILKLEDYELGQIPSFEQTYNIFLSLERNKDGHQR